MLMRAITPESAEHLFGILSIGQLTVVLERLEAYDAELGDDKNADKNECRAVSNMIVGANRVLKDKTDEC